MWEDLVSHVQIYFRNFLTLFVRDFSIFSKKSVPLFKQNNFKFLLYSSSIVNVRCLWEKFSYHFKRLRDKFLLSLMRRDDDYWWGWRLTAVDALRLTEPWSHNVENSPLNTIIVVVFFFEIVAGDFFTMRNPFHAQVRHV